MESLDRVSPPVSVHQIVPIGDEVAERTALMAERHAAVHAAGRLLRERLLGVGEVDLLPVAHTLGDRPRGPLVALDLEETSRLTHRRPLRAHGTTVPGLPPVLAPPPP
jgi:hypothetical protein